MRYFIFLIFIFACAAPQERVLHVVSDGNAEGVLTFNSLEEALEMVENKRKKDNDVAFMIRSSKGTHRLKSALKIKQVHGNLKLTGGGIDKTYVKGSKVLELGWKQTTEKTPSQDMV